MSVPFEGHALLDLKHIHRCPIRRICLISPFKELHVIPSKYTHIPIKGYTFGPFEGCTKGPFEGHILLSEEGSGRRMDLVGQNEKEIFKDACWPKIQHTAKLKPPVQAHSCQRKLRLARMKSFDWAG